MKRKIVMFVLLLSVVFVNASFAKSTYQVSGVVNLNSATQAELVLIPGIGEAKADAILEYRAQKSFDNKEELLAVKGIGENLLDKIAPYIVLSGETTIEKTKTEVQ